MATNKVSLLFRELFREFHHDASSPRIEELTADIAAHVAAQPHPVCAGIVRPDAVASCYGLVYLLAHYGLTARQQFLPSGDGAFVFLECGGETESEYSGAMVNERPRLYEVTV